MFSHKKRFFTVTLLVVVPMILLTLNLFGEVRKSTREQIFRQLESISSIHQSQIKNEIEKYHNMTLLATGRGTIQRNLASIRDLGSDAQGTESGETPQDGILRLLEKVEDAYPGFSTMLVKDLNGNPVVGLDGYSKYDSIFSLYDSSEQPSENSFMVDLVYDHITQEVHVYMIGAVYYELERVGSIHAIIDGSELLRIVSDYSGLQETGELVLSGVRDGNFAPILPLRSGVNIQNWSYEYREKETDERAKAAVKDKTALASRTRFYGIQDYRGQDILAVARYIEDVNWTITVKIDEEEAYQDLYEIKKRYGFVFLGCLLVFVFMLLGSYMGCHVAQRSEKR